MTRSILITGATGFVGRHLLQALGATFPDAALHTPRVDVTDAEAITEAVRSLRPTDCVHLAAVAAIPAARRDPDQAWRINLHGTLTLARTLLAHAPDCLLLFPSSADAYGASFRRGHALDETVPLAPMNTYGATKAAADLALGAMTAEGLRVIRVRPFNHTGAGQTADFVVPAFARQAARIAAGLQAPVMQVGALDPYRDFLDVRDVCAAYAACLLRADGLPNGAILNIASGAPRRIGGVLDGVLRAAGVTAEIQTDSSRLRAADIPTATGDASLARRLLGWAPSIPWDQTVADVVEDWRQRVAAGE